MSRGMFSSVRLTSYRAITMSTKWYNAKRGEMFLVQVEKQIPIPPGLLKPLGKISDNKTDTRSTILTHSRLRMPQGSLARGEGCLQADFRGVLTCFQGTLGIGNMLVFTIIFDVYDTYGAEVSHHMSLPYSFSFNCHK